MPPVFEFKHIDEEGHEVLTVLKSADRLNRWMYETIAHASRGRILEIGSGTGNISQQFLEHGHDITLSDIRENYRSILRDSFAHYPNLRGVVPLDLVDEDFDIKYRELLGTFDTVFALNVIEHIEDDHAGDRQLPQAARPRRRADHPRPGLSVAVQLDRPGAVSLSPVPEALTWCGCSR